jgi:hypothetical protein
MKKAELARRLEALISNPGTKEEGETARRILADVNKKYGEDDCPVRHCAEMPEIRCADCVSASMYGSYPSAKVLCLEYPGTPALRVDTYYFASSPRENKSPDWCPHKILASLKGPKNET